VLNSHQQTCPVHGRRSKLYGAVCTVGRGPGKIEYHAGHVEVFNPLVLKFSCVWFHDISCGRFESKTKTLVKKSLMETEDGEVQVTTLRSNLVYILSHAERETMANMLLYH